MQSEQQQRIMGYFIEEAKDHLGTLEKGLLNLQSTIADSEMIGEVFRAAHSVKGGAAMLGLDSIQKTSHRLEDYFKILKECPIQVDQKLETLLLRVFDTLQDLLEHLQGPFGLTDEKSDEVMAEAEPIFNQLNAHLNTLVDQSGGAKPIDVDLSALPLAARSGPTINEAQLTRFFQQNVSVELRNLLTLFKQPDSPTSREQLQAICQSLRQQGEAAGVAQPWTDLINATQRAIAYSPNSYRQLAPIVIKTLKQAQTLGCANQCNDIQISDALLQLQPPQMVTQSMLSHDEPTTSTDGPITDLQDDFQSDLTASFLGDDSFVSNDIDAFDDSVGAIATLDEMDDSEATTIGTEVDNLIDALDSNEVNATHERLGPQVGPEEMDSLADLFASDPSSLSIDWSENHSSVGDTNDLSDDLALEAVNDFSDLLFDPDSEILDDGAELAASEDDISAILNTFDFDAVSPEETDQFDSTMDQLSEVEGLSPEVAISSEELEAEMNSEELDDLFEQSAVTTSIEESMLPGNDPGFELFENGEASGPEFDEDIEEFGFQQIAATTLQQGESDFSLEAEERWETSESTLSVDASELDNLGAFFAGMESDADGMETEIEDDVDQDVDSPQLLLDEFDGLFAAMDAAEEFGDEFAELADNTDAEPNLTPIPPVVEDVISDPWEVSNPSASETFDHELNNALGDPWADSWDDAIAPDIAAESIDDDAIGFNEDSSDEWSGNSFNIDDVTLFDNDFDAPSDSFTELDDPFVDQNTVAPTAVASAFDSDADMALSGSDEDLAINDQSTKNQLTEEDDILDSLFGASPAPDPDVHELDGAEADSWLNTATDARVITDMMEEDNEDDVLASVDADTDTGGAFGFLDELSEEVGDDTEALYNQPVTDNFGLDDDDFFDDLTLSEGEENSDNEAVNIDLASADVEADLDLGLSDDDFDFGLDDPGFTVEDSDSTGYSQANEPSQDLADDLAGVLDDMFDDHDIVSEPIVTDTNMPPPGISGFGDSFDDIFETSQFSDEQVEPTRIKANADFDSTADFLDPDQSDAEDFLADRAGSDDNSADYDELDALLDDDATIEDDFSLYRDDAVLADNVNDDFSADIGFDNKANITDNVSHAEDDDDFAELDALLDDADENTGLTATTDSTIDDFAELDALLSDSDTATQPVSIGASTEEDDFADLEKLLEDADQTMGGSPTTKIDARQSPAPARRPSPRGISNQTMRVSVKNLDDLNNMVGELVVNRNSLEQSQERLRQFLDNLLYQVQQLSDVGQRMRDLYERSLLESSLLSSRRSYHATSPGKGTTTVDTFHATGANFDALEMDRFTGFHTLSQEMIELIVRVRESASDIDFVVDETDQVTRMFRQVTTQLQEGLTRTRMVPFAQAADRLPRAVRDISIKCGKQAQLVVEGRDTLIDKMILEQLYDPMTHLVNNAITHGIETPEERVEQDKNPVGTITIRTFHQGNQTIISVTDDGGGIDPDVVKQKAVAKGLITVAEAKSMSKLDVYDLLFHHGFSTRDKADDFAGRGVGMDVVRTSLSEIRGVISIDSTIGQGTTFTIRLPLTLSISKALLCISNRASIAFPMDGVEDMLDIPKDRVQTNDQGQPCIMWRDVLLPFRPLSDLLKFNRSLGRRSVYGGGPEDDVISVIVLRSAGNYLALQVDQVIGEQEIVIKQLESPVPKPAGIAGATVLGDGRIMPIADVLELIDLSMGRIRRESSSALWDQNGKSAIMDAPATGNDPTVLIVDDSITVRELLSMTFNKVGYRVEQARDGQEAWEKLRSGLPCDLVFCDIEMPRMDGLELLSRLQKDPNFSTLPIAMLTSRGADRHRQMAVQLGAKGYFTKPYLEEALLDAAQRMLKGEVLVGADG